MSSLVDLLPLSPGSLLKTREKAGEGWQTPRDAAKVHLEVNSISIRSKGSDADSSLDGFEKKVLEFTVGNGEVCDALEFAVAEMKRGEHCIVTCKDVSLCAEPRLGLQRGDTMEVSFALHLVQFDNGTEMSQLSEEEQLMYAAARKEMGSSLFKAGRVKLALGRYSKVSELFGYVESLSPSARSQALELRRLCLLNMAACQLKLRDFAAARDSCSKVLIEDSCNEKALFRRAQASLELGDAAASCRDLRAVADRDPQNREARELLLKAKARLKEETSKKGLDKDTCSKMCAGLGTGPIPEPARAAETAPSEDRPSPSLPKKKEKEKSPDFNELPREQQDMLMGKLLNCGKDCVAEDDSTEKLRDDDREFFENKAAWPSDESDEN